LRITITEKLVSRTAQEGASVAFTVKVYTDTSEPWVLATPTTLRYRVDDPETGCEILAWTAGSAASSQTVNVTASGVCGREKRRLTIQSDVGLTTAAVASRDYYVTGTDGLTT
jgi:hypothetical protein